MLFILLGTFVLTNMFFKKNNKIVSTDTGYIIYYIYLLSYFLNIMVNFICFYWMIREQYNQPDMKMPQKKDNKILDEDYIIRESIRTTQELSNSIFLEEKDKKTAKQKSLYSNTFSDADDRENQENYFVKKDENSEKLDDNININRETQASYNAINSSNFINIK